MMIQQVDIGRHTLTILTKTLLTVGALAAAPQVQADFSFDAEVESSLVAADTSSDGTRRVNGESTSWTLNPSVSLTYNGPIAAFVWNIDHTYLYQDAKERDGSQDQSFTEYQISGNVDLVENYLRLNAGSQLRYRNTDPSLAFADDFISGSQNLGKLRTNFASLRFSSATQRWFDLNWEVKGSRVESDQSVNSLTNLDNTNLATYFDVRQGREFKQLRWSVVNTWQDTQGSRTNNDLISRRTNFKSALGVYGPFSLYVTASDERNQFNGVRSAGLAEFTSYGAGFEWFESNNRKISIAFNQAEGGDDNDTEQYVSFDSVWAFTSRTRLEASYGRRSFGDSGEFSFVYNTKKFRVAASYNENLTTFSRLISNFEELGVFVCPVGTVDQNQCFLPSSLAYELQPDEQFNSLFQNIPEISEEVIVRRFGRLSAGFDANKLTFSVTLNGGRTKFIDTQREQNNMIASVSINYKAGAKTSAFGNINYNQTDFLDTNSRNQILKAESGIRHQVNPDLSVSSQIIFTDSDTVNLATTYQERRISVSLIYRL